MLTFTFNKITKVEGNLIHFTVLRSGTILEGTVEGTKDLAYPTTLQIEGVDKSTLHPEEYNILADKISHYLELRNK